MHSQFLRARPAQVRRTERGAVAIIVALSLTALLVLAALVIDFGIVRVDRQVDKSAADSATLAGLHALNAGDGNPHPYMGVCAAIQYLKHNSDRFDSVDENDDTRWTDGAGNNTASGCTNATLRAQTCTPGSTTSWARFTWSGDYQGAPLSVAIQSGYQIPTGVWGEDNLQASLDDATDGAQGCDQLAIIVSQTREPGLGSLATSSDLKTAIRSVGRVHVEPAGDAPAMLLLKRTNCAPNPLQIGGSNSYIHVLGFAGSGVSQAGTIHSDNAGNGGCASNGGKQVFNGANVSGSIVAYAAPLLSNTSSPDPSKPGLITSVAGSQGVSQDIVRDAFADVYGATGLNSSASGTHQEATGRSLVSRQPVDARYLSTVKQIVSNSTSIWSLNFANAAAAHSNNWGFATCANNGSIAAGQIDAYNAAYTNGLFIKCDQVTSVPGEVIASWKTIVFSGSLKTSGGGSIKLPDASKVYIANSAANANATTISGTGASFQMHTTGLTGSVATTVFPDGKRCLPATSSDRGLLVVKGGKLGDDYLFRACNTTVVLLGGDTNGCMLPSSYNPDLQTIGPAPTHSPCPSNTSGSGQVNVNGFVDWTAPNACTVITASLCDATALAGNDGWHNVNGPEDLALWSESAAFGSTNAVIGGTSQFNLRGVFMTPNYDPLNLGGGPNTTLTNAQFIASALNLNGGAQLTMSVDPNSAVKLKELKVVGLVR